MVESRPTASLVSEAPARPGYNSRTQTEYVDSAEAMKEKALQIAFLIKNSNHVTIYTGAGMSTSSGTPDYATSKNSKLVRPTDNGNRLERLPSIAHIISAAMQSKGYIHHWLNQNHDRLSQKAGFPQDLTNEIHGAWGDDMNPVVQMDGVLRSDLNQWMQLECERTDLCLVVGTSVCGMASDCIAEECARNPDKKLVIVNLQEIQIDEYADVRVFGLIDNFFQALAKALKIQKSDIARVRSKGQSWIQSHPGCRYRTPKINVARK